MAKRFIDSGIYTDPWFYNLKPTDKCFWIYVLCSCDHAGLWKGNIRLAEHLVGGKFNIEEINKGKMRLIKINEDDFFIPDFIRFQYGKLNENVKAHLSVINILKEKSLWDLEKGSIRDIKGLPNPSVRAIYIDKDKAKDKDKDKKKEFAQFVKMTEEEYKKLVDEYDEDFTKACIERLSNYKGANGKTYKSDYLAILNWVVKTEKQTGDWEEEKSMFSEDENET